MTDSLIITEFPHNSDTYRKMVVLRYRVLREPLGLDYTPEFLAAEAGYRHFAAYRNGEMVGGVMLSDAGNNTARLRQLAVAPEAQGTGVGHALVRFFEETARSMGFHTARLLSREDVRVFYEKLGYVSDGEPFIEVTIPHRWMVKAL